MSIVELLDSQIKSHESELAKLRKARDIFAPNVSRPKKKTVKLGTAASLAESTSKVLGLMRKNGQVDFSVTEIATMTKLKSERVRRAIEQLSKDGVIVEAGLRQRQGRAARTYALTP